MFRRRRPRLLTVALVVAIPLVLVLGLWLGGHPSILPGPVRDVVVAKDVRTLSQALDRIEDDYYREVDSDEVLDAALSGAVEDLDDRFSSYLDPATFRRFRNPNQFSGVGVSVAEDRRGLRVVEVFEDSPAARAGIREGDVIVAANGRDLGGRPQAYATALIRGRPGTTVRLTVSRDGSERTIRVRRARIEAPVVSEEMRTVDGRKLGVVELSGFTPGAHGELQAAIARLRRAGAKGLVLDLRGNGGGLLREAVLVASTFIEDGTIVTTDGRSRDRQVFRASGGAIPRSIPLVVLVDRGTASAAEIVTAAVQERGRGKVVGTRTFGKGVFQEVSELPNGGALDITVGQYFTPKGRNLGGSGTNTGAGVRPDVRAVDRPATERDEALDVALRELAGEVR